MRVSDELVMGVAPGGRIVGDRLLKPGGLCVDSQLCGERSLLFAATDHVRALSLSTGRVRTLLKSATYSVADPTVRLTGFSGLSILSSIAVEPHSRSLIAVDYERHSLLRISPPPAGRGDRWTVRPLAGIVDSPGFADGPFLTALFNRPSKVLILADGDWIVCDRYGTHSARAAACCLLPAACCLLPLSTPPPSPPLPSSYSPFVPGACVCASSENSGIRRLIPKDKPAPKPTPLRRSSSVSSENDISAEDMADAKLALSKQSGGAGPSGAASSASSSLAPPPAAPVAATRAPPLVLSDAEAVADLIARSEGRVETIIAGVRAGAGTPEGDGPLAKASLMRPIDVAVDPKRPHVMYVVETHNTMTLRVIDTYASQSPLRLCTNHLRCFSPPPDQDSTRPPLSSLTISPVSAVVWQILCRR
jgi:hypothetical protein